MDDKEEIKKELGELAPKLEKIEKQNPFKVPDYYFQSLPDKVMEKVGSSGQPLPWTDKLEHWLNQAFSSLFNPRYAIPVSVFLLSLVVGISFYKSKMQAPVDVAHPLSEIPSEEIRDYLIENFDDGDFIALGSAADQRSGFMLNDIPSDELEDYLKNNSDNQTPEEEIL